MDHLGIRDMTITPAVKGEGYQPLARFPTTPARVSAREIATFSRVIEQNSTPRSDESPMLAHMEKTTTAASCPLEIVHDADSDVR